MVNFFNSSRLVGAFGFGFGAELIGFGATRLVDSVLYVGKAPLVGVAGRFWLPTFLLKLFRRSDSRTLSVS
ncbi:hypothetical protein F4804DRAFT_304685 [Jackrogersella minutella]|nr:hypothetical protein F4804DRAFT_304685 [Jackrogersella minutella]